MTVRELITELQAQPPDRKVVIYDDDSAEYMGRFALKLVTVVPSNPEYDQYWQHRAWADKESPQQVLALVGGSGQ